uniref:Membrane-associated tyrosine- and threonine-specific cdc2-inhibitory kinase n=1 Tax=Plectus sambesii TaxID=2011161 RepID=A0A914VD32_9BILA
MMDLHTPPVVAARPTPKFYNSGDSPLSTKKNRTRTTPLNRYRPVHAIARTAPAVSRVYPRRYSLQKPHFISFKTRSDNLLDRIASRHYDESSSECYFDQCFEKEKKLGEGSFGEVFRVRSKEDGRRYAVKRALERFRNANDRQLKLIEVQKHELLPKHCNLVNFVRAWEENGRLYIQTELCECSLSEFANSQHDISEQVLWNFLVDLLLAVKHLHDFHLLHLDIKPENIFITHDNVCKLGDFGLIFDLKMGDITTAQEGDSKYLAPEMLDGRIGKPADIYSLGLTMLELACDLDLPSNGIGWQMLRNGQLPEDLMTHLSPDLGRLIRWMMDPDPDRRPSAEQLMRDSAIQSHYYKRSFYLWFHEISTSARSAFLTVWLVVTSLLALLFKPLWHWIGGDSLTSKEQQTPKAVPGGHTPRTDQSAVFQRLLFENSFSDDDEQSSVLHNMTSIHEAASMSPVKFEMLNDDTSSTSSANSSSEDCARVKQQALLNSTPKENRFRARQLNGVKRAHTTERMQRVKSPVLSSNVSISPSTMRRTNQEAGMNTPSVRQTTASRLFKDGLCLSPIPLNISRYRSSPFRSRQIIDHGSSGEEM